MANNNRIHADLYQAARALNEIHRMYGQNSLAHTSTKYQFLPQTTKRISGMMLREARYQRRRNYRKFKRGSLVFVEFGVNVGKELSNRHWAVVLDKSDYVSKGTLTVVPVSSKERSDYVKIDEVIAKNPFAFIEEYLISSARNIYFACRNTEGGLETYMDGEFKTTLALLHERFGDEYSESEKFEVDKQFLTEAKVKLIKIYELVLHYVRFTEASYAKCSNITTISKDRIIFINDMDPCGRFSVNEDTLDRIDQKVAELYIK